MVRHSKDAQDAGALSSAHFPEMEAGLRRDGRKRESRFGEDTGHDHSATDLEKMDPQAWDDEKRSAAVDSDDPFTGKGENEIQYKTMEWWQAAMLMFAETVSLGILSLPSVVANLGMVPGVILIVGLGLIATYTGYAMFQFKMRHPHVANLADAGEVVFGPIGREVLGAGLVILLVFAASSHILTFTIAMNVITQHATCTIVWAAVALVLFFIASIPRTLKNVSYLSIIAFCSVIAAVMVAMIGLGIERPDPVVRATVSGVKFASAFSSVANIVFAYQGHAAFFSFINELKDPRQFPKALCFLQTCAIGLYLVVSVVIYRYAGAEVSSPALGSMSKTVSRIAYGVALPTILVAAVVYIHVSAKYVYLRMFRGTKHMTSKSLFSVGTWIGIVAVLWVIAFVIAESIPNFNGLLGLIASLFASWFTYSVGGTLWLHNNRGQYFRDWKKASLTVINVFIILIGATVCGAGLYASGITIAHSGGHVWSCADNS